MEQLDTFLAEHPPFDGLAAADRAALAAEATIRELDAGEVVLVEDGPPAGGLWVIVTGAVELVHDGEIVAVLEPGESFGHPSLLSGMAPTFTVRAREPSRCAVVAPAAARRALATEAGLAYVAQTMRRRLTSTGHIVHGLRDVGTTPVSAIMRPPAFCPPGATIRQGLARLGEPGVTALLLEDGDGLALVSDAEIRAAAADERLSLDAPISTVARRPVVTVPVGQLAIEATVDMLAADAEHVAVLDGDAVCGVLSARDLLGLDVHSPIGLRHTILGAADAAVLERAASHLPALFLTLHRAGVPPRDLGRVLSLQHDAVVARLIDFALAQHGPAPVPWAWLDLGSAARREFTLASDQDNALAYAGTTDGVDAYFAALGHAVNDGLTRCGIGLDNNGVLAGDRRWRMSRERWLATFDACLTDPTESHLVRATVAFDFRSAAGGLTIAPELSARIRAAREHGPFMRLVARSAARSPVALGFRGQLHPGADGRIDLKRGAIIPLVNVVRYHAIANAITISPTSDRIEATTAAGGLERGDADALAEAFDVICRVRFAHHAACVAADAPVDNLIDPGALTPIVGGDLREALHSVRRAQKRLPV